MELDGSINEAHAEQPQTADAQRPRAIVGIGASAGGLEALEILFDNMPPDTGLAFVVVQHLSPDFKSLMDELLSRHTKIQIHRVDDGMAVAPNAIYLMPPKKEMIISGGRLLLTDEDRSQSLTLPIDVFFRSLAQDAGQRATAVVLSGTGSDGSRGVRAIHEAGGVVIVQDPYTAKFDGMPKSAIDTGVVDYITPLEAIPEAILANLDHPGERAELAGIGGAVSEEGMNAIFRILRDECGIDFSHYKQSTVSRRVERRLQLIQAIDLDDYVRRLREDRTEVNSLYHDLLIGVTEFFRDTEAFERLERDVIPQLLDRHKPGEELQATNEELVASNEELQSTNEELHSVNEELYTVNAEHQRKIGQLTQLTNDMDNLLQSIDVGTIFLDRDLCIRKFTARITDVFHILPQDVGRRIDSFASNIDDNRLVEDVARVFNSEELIEREVRDRRGRWYLLRILPYRVESTVQGVVVTLVAVDLLKRTERELKLMSKVFQDGADPIIIEDLTGHVIHVNDEAQRAYGWSREELLGSHIDILVPAEERGKSIEYRRRCKNAEAVRNFETVRRAKSGNLCPVLLTLSLLTDETGEPVAIASIAKDITDRKNAEVQCQEAVDRRDQFLAMLSHELRNPLGAVLNAAYVLEQNCQTKAHCTNPCQVIERQATLMSRLLDDLLDVSRVTQGKIDIRCEPCDLRNAVDEALEVVRPHIEGRDQQLHVDVEPVPLIVYGDLSRLQQIQVNLLTNAMKYTPAGGQIWLSVRHEGDEVVLRVRDTGEGIPPEMLHCIFDLFVQAGGTLDRSDGGMGVGLTLVRKLVEIHHGRVEAFSKGLGKGSEFVVRLPACFDQASPAGAGEDSDVFVQQGRVLLVEDNPDSREMLKSLLELHGYQVVAAADGIKGLESLSKHRFDIALVDIGLPGMDGYQVARTIRKDPRHASIRLVALTGYGRSADRAAVKAAGFDEHLVKPLDRRELTRALRESRR